MNSIHRLIDIYMLFARVYDVDLRASAMVLNFGDFDSFAAAFDLMIEIFERL